MGIMLTKGLLSDQTDTKFTLREANVCMSYTFSW